MNDNDDVIGAFILGFLVGIVLTICGFILAG